MKVIKNVKVSKEELGIIDRVANLDCTAIQTCLDCPLHVSNDVNCIKCLAINTLDRLTGNE